MNNDNWVCFDCRAAARSEPRRERERRRSKGSRGHQEHRTAIEEGFGEPRVQRRRVEIVRVNHPGGGE